MSKKICMLVTNPVTNDPRVRREASTFAKAGYQVTIIGVGLIVGAFAGRARWLILVAVVLIPTLLFSPVFEWLDKQDRSPDLLVYFTDANGEFPGADPPYPVIWLVKGKSKVPWGIRIQLN